MVSGFVLRILHNTYEIVCVPRWHPSGALIIYSQCRDAWAHLSIYLSLSIYLGA